MTDSSLGRGLSLIRCGFDGSMLIASAGRLSVIRLMNKSCTAVNGIGSPIREAYRTASMPAAFPDKRNFIAFLMLAYMLRPLSTDLIIVAKLSSVRIMEAESFATSVPVMPMATPTSALFSAGPSLTPSPVIATM